MIRKMILVLLCTAMLGVVIGCHPTDTVGQSEQSTETATPTESQKETEMPTLKSDAFTADTKIQDVIDYPAFCDWGRLIFPVNKSYYSGNTLGDLDLTWYSQIRPEKTVEICNYCKDHADAGDTVFYDIYTNAEKAADPSLNDTGLFFFKGTPGAKFAVCNAGGGMVFVGSMHDSFPHALEISKEGYNAFAVIYRAGYETGPRDCARAVAFIIEHAEELEVDPNDYSLWGGSAGARIADWVGTNGTAYYGEKDYPQAAAVIMQYTALSEVTGHEPATYNCVGTWDGIAPYETMQARINRIKENGTDTMIEIFDGLSHGFGIGLGTVAEGWVGHAIAFWERNMKTSSQVTAPITEAQSTVDGTPIVFFTSDISAEGLMRLYEALVWQPTGTLAVKVSTGEPPSSNYLRQELIGELVQSLNGTYVECMTAYGGQRSSIAMAKQVAADHGFSPFVLLDENGSMTLPVKTYNRISENYVGAGITNFDSMLVLSHFKGHAMAGFGGAIKNISIGLGSVEGKNLIHTGGKSHTNWWGGDQTAFTESMAEAASSVADYYGDRIIFINVMNRLSVDCDCDGHPAEPDIHDIGILASFDPVALDQACVDLVWQAEGNASLVSRIESRNGLHTLEHAEEIGLGSRTYTLINIDE